MKRVHIKLRYGYENPSLCGDHGQSGLYYSVIATYLKYPNFDDFTYPNKLNSKWCPDCLKHPEVVMARLSETNV